MLNSTESFAFLNSAVARIRKVLRLAQLGKGNTAEVSYLMDRRQGGPHNNWKSISTHFFLGLKLSAFLRTSKIFLIWRTVSSAYSWFLFPHNHGSHGLASWHQPWPADSNKSDLSLTIDYCQSLPLLAPVIQSARAGETGTGRSHVVPTSSSTSISGFMNRFLNKGVCRWNTHPKTCLLRFPFYPSFANSIESSFLRCL